MCLDANPTNSSGILMSSNDSLNNDPRGTTMDPNEIIRSSGAFVPSVLSSPSVARREFVPQSGYIQTVPPPQHGRMLVDPTV